MAAFLAFLHHLAAFSLAGAVAVQFVLIRGELSAENARKLSLADAVLGASALLALIVGLLRVFYFERLGSMPAVARGRLRAIRSIIHWELAGVVVILFCAALMARGVGFVGSP